MTQIPTLQQRFTKGEIINFEKPVLILATASPKRAEVLDRAGVQYTKILSEINESEIHDKFRHHNVSKKYVRNYVHELALAKIAPYKDKIINGAVVTADTVILCKGQILEKPLTKEKCREQHLLLSGCTNYAITAVAAYYNGQMLCKAKSTKCKVQPLSEQTIEEICNEPETLNCAGYRTNGAFGRYCKIKKSGLDNLLGIDVKLMLRMLKKIGFTAKEGL